jgi:hypothetical protein
MSNPSKDFRDLLERVRRHPNNFVVFLGELHSLLQNLYETTARADGNTQGFSNALVSLCQKHEILGWADFVSPDEQRQYFRYGSDPDAQRIIAFWAELDEPVSL